MKRLLIASALLLAAVATVFAQSSGVPYFPQTLPGQTVVGRLSKTPGATEAIPFDFLRKAVFTNSPWLVTQGGTGANTAADARTNLGLAIGTNVQAFSSDLANFVTHFNVAADGLSITPEVDGNLDLGSGAKKFQHLFLKSGGEVNFGNGNVTIRHAASKLNFLAATNGYSFDNPVLLSSYIDLAEIAAPSSPAADTARLYAKTAGTTRIFYRDSAGTESELANVGSLGTYTSLSSTSVTITGIPANTKKVVVNIVGMSMDASAAFRIRIGPSGGVATSGYLGASGQVVNAASPTTGNFTAGVDLGGVAATGVFHGHMVFTLAEPASNTWTYAQHLGRSDAAVLHYAFGSVPLSGAFERITFTSVAGTANFDAGSVSVLTYQ
jgi:hypothetical protein